MFRVKFYLVSGRFATSGPFNRYEQADSLLMDLIGADDRRQLFTGAQIEVQMPNDDWSVACEPEDYV